METKLQESLAALLALSHTPGEQRLYETLIAAAAGVGAQGGSFSLSRLLALTGLNSYSTLRRARTGLVEKLSIDCKGNSAGEDGQEQQGSVYIVYGPEEIFRRRRQAGLELYPKEYQSHADHMGFSPALARVANGHNLSRREAQVALCCAEGLTNAEIGAKLFITEQTVKFHLRHVFIKFGVRRRGELISRLLRQEREEGEGQGLGGGLWVDEQVPSFS
ncbi:MAG: helix-turn-helix transcriptional regulator [Pyrinomonadaceae bacterium]